MHTYASSILAKRELIGIIFYDIAFEDVHPHENVIERFFQDPIWSRSLNINMLPDDLIKWKYFPSYWPFVSGIHRSTMDSRQKASDAELWYLLWSAPEQTVEQKIETLVIWDTIALIMTSL